MAGDWIKVEHATVDKPEVIRLADLMGFRHPDQAVGLLVRFWVWLDRNLRDDSVTLLYAKTIDSVTHENGFCGALCAIGWAEMDEKTGIVTIKNIERHNGNPAKTRALTRDRNVTLRLRDRDANSVNREEKIRVTTKTPTPLVAPLPEWLSAEVWSQFETHRIACKAKLTPRGRELALKTLGKLKAEGGDPLAIIEQSIERGWKGLFPVGQPVAKVATAAWWTSEPATLAKGKELGIAPRGGESMSDYRGRISEAVQARAIA